MADLKFYTGTDHDLELAGSGLGFYGSTGFGASVSVGEYQDTTYITDGTGVTQGAEAPNVKWTHANSGIIGAGASSTHLQSIPNYQSTLNVRFTHTSSVRVESVELYVYDRVSINNAASGVTTKAAEIIHPEVAQTATGSGDSAWITPAGSSTTVPLAESPGISGLYAADGVSTVSTRQDTRHDWYVALSASPDSIGSKSQYGLYVSCEYF